MPHVSANDVELYYEMTGDGDPLVLVHGGWSDHANWQAVAPALAESFRVVTYDRRGHSQSERPVEPGSRRDQEDDLAALIAALDCAPAHVAGTSFGASIAIGLATRRPELLRSVIAHEPPLMSLVADDPQMRPLMAEVRETIQSVLERIDRGDIEGGARQFVEEVALGPGAREQLPAQIRETAVENGPAVVDEQRDPDWAYIDPSALSRHSIPVLLTQGDQSPTWFFAIVAELARLGRCAEVRTFAGAGHAPHLTHPDDHIELLSDFLQPIPGDRSRALAG